MSVVDEEGRFVSHMSYFVPPGLACENYVYHRARKCEFIGKSSHLE